MNQPQYNAIETPQIPTQLGKKKKTQSSSENKKKLVLMIFIIVVLAATVVGVYMYSESQNEKEEKEKQEAENAKLAEETPRVCKIGTYINSNFPGFQFEYDKCIWSVNESNYPLEENGDQIDVKLTHTDGSRLKFNLAPVGIFGFGPEECYKEPIDQLGDELFRVQYDQNKYSYRPEASLKGTEAYDNVILIGDSAESSMKTEDMTYCGIQNAFIVQTLYPLTPDFDWGENYNEGRGTIIGLLSISVELKEVATELTISDSDTIVKSMIWREGEEVSPNIGGKDGEVAVNRYTLYLPSDIIKTEIVGTSREDVEKFLIEELFRRGIELAAEDISNCDGGDFTLDIINKKATIHFCKGFYSSDLVGMKNIKVAIESNLTQFESVDEVSLLSKAGECFDISVEPILCNM